MISFEAMQGQLGRKQRGSNMPMVGKQKFPYTAKGKAAAKKAAKKTGATMKKKNGK